MSNEPWWVVAFWIFWSALFTTMIVFAAIGIDTVITR